MSFNQDKLQGLITEEDKENENEESESEDETKLGEKLHEEHTNVYESYVLVNINKSNIIVFISFIKF